LRRWLATLSDNPEEVAEKIGLLGKHRVPGLPGLVVAITTDEDMLLERLPDAHVVGLFIARRAIPSPFEAVSEEDLLK
jgi:hypothetical protein